MLDVSDEVYVTQNSRSEMSLLVARYIRDIFIILEKRDIESDVYNNALSISTVISKLHSDGNISDFDLKVLNYIAIGHTYLETSKFLSTSRQRVTASFKESCCKISFILGGDFTDAGFMNKFGKGKL